MKKILVLSLTSMMIATTAPAFASGKDASCATSGEKWMTTDAAKAKASELGYEVRRVKRENGCYELYAIDAKGARMEVFMHPVSGEIVAIKTK